MNGSQHQRLGRAAQREFAAPLDQAFAVESGRPGSEAGCGVALCIQHLGTAKAGIERAHTAAHGGGVDGDIDLACACGTVKVHRALLAIKAHQRG